MSLDDSPWQPDDTPAADPYLEWVFSEAHDIEYWVVRDGRLVPAESSDLERIAEWERERSAVPRLHQWERQKVPARPPSVVVRFVAWCAGLRRYAVWAHPAGPKAIETIVESDDSSRRRSDAATR